MTHSFRSVTTVFAFAVSGVAAALVGGGALSAFRMGGTGALPPALVALAATGSAAHFGLCFLLAKVQVENGEIRRTTPFGRSQVRRVSEVKKFRRQRGRGAVKTDAGVLEFTDDSGWYFPPGMRDFREFVRSVMAKDDPDLG